MKARARPICVWVLAAMAAGCEGTQADAGLDAKLRIEGAQFFRGSMPAGEEGGPAVVAVALRTNEIRAGAKDKSCGGALARPATAAAIALSGDLGYWVVPAGPPAVETPELPSFEATLAFAPTLASGAYQLVVRAVDGAGRFGLPVERSLSTAAAADDDAELAVSLRWDTEADLDLHVVDARGVEIWKRNINSGDGAILDFDSNAACLIDGRRRETVLWKTAPPAGHYIVRVDTFSLCQAQTARFRVEAARRGASLGAAEGLSTEADARFPHDRGAGVLALEFDVP
ncbi:hypothetical protein LVJ94_10270 [Pendulispora rubella]|uniref:DUF2135 domain-containing protein n=1 Tax=Pendulispora rubella TaxID=2741070 RepID=A0ABZ2LB85_9BACT